MGAQVKMRLPEERVKLSRVRNIFAHSTSSFACDWCAWGGSTQTRAASAVRMWRCPLRRLHSWTGSRFLSTSPCPGHRLKSSACLSLLTGAFASVEDGETEHLPHETNRHPYRDAKNFYVVKAPRRTQLAVENQSPKYPLTSIRQTTSVAACQGASADC